MKRLLNAGITTAVTLICLACPGWAADNPGSTTNDAQIVTITGTVKTIRNDEGMIMAVGIATDKGGMTKVFPDAKGKELGGNHGKKAEVKGRYATRAGMKVLMVSEFKVLDTKKE